MFHFLLKRFFEIPRVYKRIVTFIIDSIFIIFATALAFFFRDEITPWLSEKLYLTIGLTLLLTLALWARLGLYRAVIRFIDTKALSAIFIGSMLSGLLMVIVNYFIQTPMPRSVPFIYSALLLIFVGGSRLMIRGLISTQNSRGREGVIIFGAGSSGRQLAMSLQHGAEYRPVAFVDDNLELKNTQVAGTKVHERKELEDLIQKHQVKKILLAIPSASAKHRKKILNYLEKLPVEVLTMPGTADLVSGKLKVDVLRRVDIVDLLGREQVKPIDGLFRRCIENKNVMVTGAGGSIGSELCRQIVRQQPMSLILFESSELALYSIEKEVTEILSDANHSVHVIPILASVLDEVTVKQVLKSYSVNTIYHAAAYKHVPIVEHNVVSGIRNNVWGTMTCAEQAIVCEVENFVLISTDKAVRPTNVMGASKRLSELVLQALSEKSSNTRFSMVRFGNVLGSSGSVVPLFKKLIADGGPVTITHPDITRYFMTIPEAAQLVIQAGAMGKGGDVYVLDMGKPVKIDDLARKMIHLSGLSVKSSENAAGDIEIIYTGLRPGEKLYEELLIGENVEGTEHKRIMKAREVSMSWTQLQVLLENIETAMDAGDILKLRELLSSAPLGYNPTSDIADCLWLKKSGSSNKAERLRVV